MSTACQAIDGQEAIDPIPERDAGRSPRRDTLGAVLAALDPELFKSCFSTWVESLRETEPDLVAIDGKTSRRSHDRSKGREPLHLVSAWPLASACCSGRRRFWPSRTRSPPSRCSWNAWRWKVRWWPSTPSTPKSAIAEAILNRGGEYLLALKANRPIMFRDVEAFFTDPPPGTLDTVETIDGEHGRIEVRRHAVCHDVAWLFSDRRYPGEVAFPGLAMIGMVESATERDGRTARERRYYLGSAKLDARTFARAVRDHSSIENGLHWVLDVVFKDDLARLRTGHGPANMAVVKHMAINLLRQARPTGSLKNRRKRAGSNSAYLEQLIRQTA